MTRDDLERWIAGHRESEREQRRLLVSEKTDFEGAVARSLSLIATLRATVTQEAIELQRAEDDARVRATWNALRRALS